MSDIGKKIKQRREDIGMSADELGIKIGKNRATVYRYENGDIEGLKISALIPIARALGVSPGYFLDDLSPDIRKPSPIAALDLSNDELSLLNSYNHLNDQGKRKLLEYAEDLMSNPSNIDANSEENLA